MSTSSIDRLFSSGAWLAVASMLFFPFFLAACDDESGSTQECTPMTLTPASGEPFSGSDECSGVQTNEIYRDDDSYYNHNSAYCDSLQACDPHAACPGIAGPLSGQMLVYVFGSVSGCDATASIEQVRRCSDRIEVDYRIEGEGDCAAMVNAWTSVWIPESELTVQFNQLD